MINFTDCIEVMNNYKGSEKKKTLIYNDNKYLVKFPDPIKEKNKNISYINNAFSEYVGSHIFKLVGTQNTILGNYNYNGKNKIVCGCEDFTTDEKTLYEFDSLVLSTNPDKKIDTELSDIMEAIEQNKMIDNISIKEKFFDMFIIDSLIGNTDRHNGNWGFLLDKQTGKIEFSPIYDCGSCLNPMIDDFEIEKLNEVELKNISINIYSCIKENNKKINYMLYVKSKKNKDLNKALLRMFKKINISKINEFIDKIMCMSDTRKKFYKKIIYLRYQILENTYKWLRDNL